MPIGYMTYVSTRGEDTGAFYSDIVLKGLAADGGLYVPREYPKLAPQKIWSWKELSYHELAFKIMKRFATDMDPYRLEVLLERTYRPDRFCNGRAGEDFSQITPVRFIDEGNIGLLELSNGPTLAFKDIAMQYLGGLFEMLLTDQPGDDSWPITGLTYILVQRNQPDAKKAAALLNYFNWCYTSGAVTASRLNYVPLTGKVLELVRKCWADEIRCNGRPVKF